MRGASREEEEEEGENERHIIIFVWVSAIVVHTNDPSLCFQRRIAVEEGIKDHKGICRTAERAGEMTARQRR